MRISENMLVDGIRGSLAANRGQLVDAQNTLASGKRLNRPSDDPAAAKQILEFRGQIASLTQYRRNIQKGSARMAATDASLESVRGLLRNARNLALEQGGGTFDDQDRAVALQSAKHIYDQVMGMANTRYGDQYIFGGQRSDGPPASRDDAYKATWSGDNGDVRIIIGTHTSVSLNSDGQNPFENADGTLVFDTLKKVIDGLANGDNALVAAQADALCQAVDRVQNIQGANAAVAERLAATDTQWQHLQNGYESLLADTENADMNQTAVDLMARQTAYEAALTAASKVVGQSLLDFLK